MALVIFCVALGEAMRPRMSFSDAILSSPWRPALSAWPRTPHSSCSALCRARLILFSPCQRTWMARTNPAMTNLSEGLGETFDHALQLGRGVIAEIAAVADVIQDVDVLPAQQRQQAVLEAAHLGNRKRVQIAVDAGVDHHDLLFHLQRRELRLFQEFGQ